MSGLDSLRRPAVVGLIVVGHVVFLLLLAGIIDRRRPLAPADSTVLVVLDLEPRRPPPPPVPGVPAHPRPYPAAPTAPTPSTAITEPRSPYGAAIPGGSPAVDWHEEGARAASAESARLADESRKDCHPQDRRGTLPAHCLKPRAPAPWEPEPARAGFSGGLPWVRVGKECVVGLGFFGCALDPPPANGHVLDEMKNPQRLRSSVPDAPQ
jgi:hypothetical protein